MRLDLCARSLRTELSYPAHIVVIDNTLSISLACRFVIHLGLSHPIRVATALTYVTYASQTLMRRNAFLLTRRFDQITHSSDQMNQEALILDRTQLLAGNFVEGLGDSYSLSTCGKLTMSILLSRWYREIWDVRRPCRKMNSSPLSAEGLL
jgi:hypothetical protein